MDSKYKILIVDDDANACITLSDLLYEDGYITITAENGMQALEMAEKENPAIVLIDVRLPDIDGYEVCRRIKDNTASTTKVILYTAYVDAVNAVKAREVHADDILGKTTDYANLREAIKREL